MAGGSDHLDHQSHLRPDLVAGNNATCHPIAQATTCHASISLSDDILQKFWETEESPTGKSSIS